MTLNVNHLSFSYGSRRILDDISFDLPAGSLTAVLGANGVGKSTLFKCILGLLTDYDGKVTINATETKHLPAQQLASLAAYIPQSHDTAFNFGVFDMVLMGTTARLKGFRLPSKEQTEITLQALERLGISFLKDREYRHISGGERQLVLIARALAQKTNVLIMDEPTANLDYGNSLRVLAQMRALADQGYTILFSTHSPDHVFLYADRVLALSDRKMLADGLPKETITAELIQTLYGVNVRIESLYDDKIRCCIPRKGTL